MCRTVNYFAIPGTYIPPAEVTMRRIDAAVARAYNTTVDAIHFRSRKKEHKEPRYVAMYLMRKALRPGGDKISLKEVGDWYEVDHATVIHAVKTMQNDMRNDPDFAVFVRNISKEIAAIGKQTVSGSNAITNTKAI